ncbi:SIR2 family protein [Sphingomonas sp. OK281]|uniref:SIR2 family NAD-dependent protein deacylase n=1 Tax=Sphingomonas sp. OK281 TaxID=1881067 RepID=UPI0008E4F0D9|nr:SIR2 family protein [Sphingomonas sp. OK281]SFO44975.1 SIR2-like domain-containing protein [Sphingomonas sp. OK281]
MTKIENDIALSLAPHNDAVNAPTSSLEEASTISEAIQSILEEFDVQPVLFIGAGISRRYIGAPDWEGALRFALGQVQPATRPYSYFVQKFGDDKVAIGTAIADEVFEWAWTAGKDRFDVSLFDGPDRHVFMKALIAQHLLEITPQALIDLSKQQSAELKALADIRPHAVITTNYDELLEQIFKGYEPIVGKGVLRYDLNSFGEIFHVHGMAADPKTLVLTKPDYENWEKQSRYFAAKLLTYFVEHPVFIFGYGLGDPNVRTLLRDIGRIAADESGLIGNVAQVIWHAELKAGAAQSEVVIDDEDDGRQYRLRVFNVTSLIDVFDLLAARHELKQVNPALLRALAARLMKLTRKDIPGGTVEVDYATLEKVAQDDETLPRMLGLTYADSDNKTHPFTLSQVADELGLRGWNALDKVIKKVKQEKGVDLRSSDNRYHERIKTGKKSAVRKWSHEAVHLFSTVLAGKDYDVADCR